MILTHIPNLQNQNDSPAHSSRSSLKVELEAEAVQEHIQFTSHRNKQVLLVDLSDCSSTEVERVVRTLPGIVALNPRNSVLILSDFTRASIDQEAFRVMKETAVFNKPYTRKSAWVGADSVPQVFKENLKAFSRREFPAFKCRADALEWLVSD